MFLTLFTPNKIIEEISELTVIVMSIHRSYVVRHVRDTHRDKPLKVVDLLKSGDELPSLSDTDDKDESGDAVTDMSTLETSDESLEKGTYNFGLDARKSDLGGLRTTKVQTSLRIRTV